jgi:hypothetical protein
MAKIAALAALLTAGILLGVGLGTGGAQLVTTETTTTTIPTTTTAPGTTVVTTVQQTTTRRVPVPATTSSSSSTDDVPTWVWVVLGILAVAVVGLIVALATRGGGGGGGPAIPPAELRRRLDGAVASWAAQGWALENQTADSAVLRRGEDAMVVSIDPAGQVSTRPLGPPR